MPSLMEIPGLGGALQKRQLNQQRDLAEVQQAQGLMGILGAVQQQQQRQAALMRDQQMRGALSKLAPDATDDDVSKAITPYADAKDILHYRTQAATAREATKQRAMQFLEAQGMKQQQLDFQREQFLQRTEDGQARQRFEEYYKTESLKNQRDRAAMDAELRRMGIDIRRELAGSNKPPAGYRYKDDGSMEAIPGGPADQKLTQAGSGRETVNSLVATLRDAYDQLDKAGGITNPERGTAANLVSGIQSSGPGQFVGRFAGTQNQSLRNQIAQQRPLLLNAIKNATGMSAKQMDSNAELKLYLSAATDPTLDVKANRAALDKLDELYGLSGRAPSAATPPAPTPSPAGGLSPQEQKELDALRQRYGRGR